MARTDDKSILKNLHGAIGKTIVVKQYGSKTIVTAYPNMSRVKRSSTQKRNSKLFKEAVAYAQSINRDEKKKEAYRKKKKLRKGTSVYHAALSEFMRREN